MDSNPQMMGMTYPIALRLFQESLIVFANWTQAKLDFQPIKIDASGSEAILMAKELVAWPVQENLDILQVVFDAISLEHRQTKQHYWPAWAINNTGSMREHGDPRKRYPKIPYPSKEKPSAEQIQMLKNEVKLALEALTLKEWGNLPLLMILLEKYGSYLSFGQPDVALFDQIKTTAAVASALAGCPSTSHLCLVAGDLSGIQDFIYTISSDGALKSLRARSFTLELVTEEIVQQLLNRLQLPRTNVIYAGGGNLYLLAPSSQIVVNHVKNLRNEFNQWLFEEFQGKVFLSLTSYEFPKVDIGQQVFTNHWDAATKKLSIQKSKKFDHQLSDLLTIKPAHEPCKVCHRDDCEDLKSLNDENGVEACPTCRQMYRLGGQLFKVGALVRTSLKNISGALGKVGIRVGGQVIYYHLFESAKTIPKEPKAVYLINNWDLDLYKFPHFENPTPLLLGNYGQESDPESGFLTAQEMAEAKAKGIKRVGYLRMDVDKLGRIFAQGLSRNYTLPRLAGLSRQMSYFFKVYLNSLAEFRGRDFLDHQNDQNFQSLTTHPRQDLLFIYAGGDDLFVSGAWDQVVEFAFDVYQSFRAFTGWHPDISLSAGISLARPKYPLYQSADDSGEAESAAKGNDRDSLGLFDQVFKWQEWLGHRNQPVSEIHAISKELRQYIQDDSVLPLFGIFPFVAMLQDTLGNQYSRSFVRNLLATAQLQEQWLKKAQKEKSDQARAIRYFLHLPRVAYTLARLPVAVKNREEFDVIRVALKSPYNAPYFRAIATWLDLLNRQVP